METPEHTHDIDPQTQRRISNLEDELLYLKIEIDHLGDALRRKAEENHSHDGNH